MLKNNGGSSGGVVDDGYLINMVGVDKILNDGAGLNYLRLEVIEEEVVRLAEESELPSSLGGDNGGGAAPEAAVVDSGDSGLVVGEFVADFGFRYKGKLGFLGDVGGVAVSGGARVFEAGWRIHRRRREEGRIDEIRVWGPAS